MEGQKVISKSEHKINGSAELPITLDITRDEKVKDAPVVIFCHGFKGFKDWGCWNLVANEFANAGYCFVKINFSHNGVKANDLSDITDSEAFGNNTFSKEMDDLGLVLDWLEEKEDLQVDFNNLNLIGHSRGGPIALLKTIEDSRVKKVITWAGVFEMKKYTELAPEKEWKEKGFVAVKNGRTNQEYPIQYGFYEDYQKNKKRLDLQGNIAKLDKPYLILHGTDDNVVPIEHAKNARDFVTHSIYIEIENGDHTFGAAHPWDGQDLPEALGMVTEESMEFIEMM
jgi:pimeloyl-ACP methyl ester carboxylesterase